MTNRIFIILFISLIYSQIFSQPVISLENTPQAGLRYFYLEASYPGITMDSVGAGITWDFSDIIMTGETISNSYRVPFELLDEYPDWNPPPDTALYNFASTDLINLFMIENERYSLAYKFDHVYTYHMEVWWYMNVDLTIFPLPFEFGQSFNDSYSYITVSCDRHALANSWGTLILPDTIYDPVLRLHYYDSRHWDDDAPTPHSCWGNDYQHIYKFYTAQSDVPVFSVCFWEHIAGCEIPQEWWFDTTLLVYDRYDTLPLQILCSSDTTITTTSDTSAVWLDLPAPLLSHDIGLQDLWNDYTGTGSAAAYYPDDTTIVIWYVANTMGEIEDSCSVLVTVNITNLSMDDPKTPDIISCLNIPNPFFSHTTLMFELNEGGVAVVCVFDFQGRLIEKFKANCTKGTNRLEYYTQDLPEGIYFYRIQAGKQMGIGKLLVIK